MNDELAAADLVHELAVALQLVEAVNNGQLTRAEATRQSRLLTQLDRSAETESRLRDLQRQSDEQRSGGHGASLARERRTLPRARRKRQ